MRQSYLLEYHEMGAGARQRLAGYVRDDVGILKHFILRTSGAETCTKRQLVPPDAVNAFVPLSQG
ncbi:hypothetical protein LSP04_16020 [Levilactobacillus spicheri]|uniref:Uncharacterized protein n=1 Tax=Levilactobacillus spicheri TaxID=216463 RepID=A0ABQ0WQ32_9LACO|nr:hypothetical protein LSP04_16020 [Levilactobacillus spicheri]